MEYLLQNEHSQKEEIEITILKDVIENSLEYKIGAFSYRETSMEDICCNDNKNGIPVGSIEFVEKWLKHFYNKTMHPIEVPEVLRTPEFLKRDYNICTPSSFPSSDRFFIKNADKLKDWTYCGEIQNIIAQTHPNTNYVVSEEVSILSEWRVYVINDNIENIANYDGDITIFPDIELIKKAVVVYSNSGYRPKSYTIDIMVIPKGTAIIEIHPFTSIGLYSSLWGTSLARAYRDGIEYYINRVD